MSCNPPTARGILASGFPSPRDPHGSDLPLEHLPSAREQNQRGMRLDQLSAAPRGFLGCFSRELHVEPPPHLLQRLHAFVDGPWQPDQRFGVSAGVKEGRYEAGKIWDEHPRVTQGNKQREPVGNRTHPRRARERERRWHEVSALPPPPQQSLRKGGLTRGRRTGVKSGL